MTAINRIYSIAVQGSEVPASHTVRRWTAGLFVSAVLGTLLGISGFALGLLTALNALLLGSSGYTTGTLLIGSSFVLFGLAAHCLDKTGAAVKAARLERCRRNGLKD